MTPTQQLDWWLSQNRLYLTAFEARPCAATFDALAEILRQYRDACEVGTINPPHLAMTTPAPVAAGGLGPDAGYGFTRRGGR